MKSEELLSNIKKTEDDAKTILDDSAAKGMKRVDWAEQESSRIISAAQADSVRESELSISRAEQDIDSEEARILEEGMAEIDSRISASKASQGEAIELLLSRFRKMGDPVS